MTKMLTKSLLDEQILDCRDRRLHLGDRAMDTIQNTSVVILDHCPELGDECLYVQSTDDDLGMCHWVEPAHLMRIDP